MDINSLENGDVSKADNDQRLLILEELNEVLFNED